MRIPAALAAYSLELSTDGSELTYTYDTKGERTGITALLSDLARRRHHASRTSRPRRARWKTSSSAW